MHQRKDQRKDPRPRPRASLGIRVAFNGEDGGLVRIEFGPGYAPITVSTAGAREFALALLEMCAFSDVEAAIRMEGEQMRRESLTETELAETGPFDAEEWLTFLREARDRYEGRRQQRAAQTALYDAIRTTARPKTG